MIDPATSQRWLYRLLFAAVAAGLIFLGLLPVETAPRRVPGPDMLLCLTFVWVQRRPDFVPPLVLVAVFLAADLLTQRPPGLWTLLVLIGAEFLRSRHHGAADMPLATELAFSVVTIVAVILANTLILTIFAVDHAGLRLAVIQMLMTILFYPVAIVLSRVAFGLRRPPAGQPEARRVLR